MNTMARHVLIIIGSPRRGNTHRICQTFADKVAVLNPMVSFEYLFLKDAHIEMCHGCQVCLLKGVEKCPLKDDIPLIVDKLTNADSLILAAPGYNQHVPGIMKNFIDRMSFNCHSSSLYGKTALAIATVGGLGVKQTLKYLTLIARCWGTHVVGSLSVLMDYQNNVTGYKEKTERGITRLAQIYAKSLESSEKPVPNFQDMLVFAALREETRFSPYFREYWKEMGWANADYYYSTKINLFNLILARIMGFIIKKEMETVFKNQS